jgi:hypothetical protein
VAVGIRLDHRHDPAAWSDFADAGEIAAQCAGADFSADQRLQRSTPAAYASGMKFWKRVYLPWKVSVN